MNVEREKIHQTFLQKAYEWDFESVSSMITMHGSKIIQANGIVEHRVPGMVKISKTQGNALIQALEKNYSDGTRTFNRLEKTVDLLLEKGCPVDVCNKYEQTPLHLALKIHGDIGISIASKLVGHNANPFSLDYKGRGPLDMLEDDAVRKLFAKTIKQMHPGYEANLRNLQKKWIYRTHTKELVKAMRKGDLKKFKEVLSQCHSVNRVYENSVSNISIIALAAAHGQSEFLKVLIERDAVLDDVLEEPLKIGLLSLAIASGDLPSVIALANAGIKLNTPLIEDNESMENIYRRGYPPHHDAFFQGNVRMSQFLLDIVPEEKSLRGESLEKLLANDDDKTKKIHRENYQRILARIDHFKKSGSKFATYWQWMDDVITLAEGLKSTTKHTDELCQNCQGLLIQQGKPEAIGPLQKLMSKPEQLFVLAAWMRYYWAAEKAAKVFNEGKNFPRVLEIVEQKNLKRCHSAGSLRVHKIKKRHSSRSNRSNRSIRD
jgi:hypothetical protein